jgi:hypothetical protein
LDGGDVMSVAAANSSVRMRLAQLSRSVRSVRQVCALDAALRTQAVPGLSPKPSGPSAGSPAGAPVQPDTIPACLLLLLARRRPLPEAARGRPRPWLLRPGLPDHLSSGCLFLAQRVMVPL